MEYLNLLSINLIAPTQVVGYNGKKLKNPNLIYKYLICAKKDNELYICDSCFIPNNLVREVVNEREQKFVKR